MSMKRQNSTDFTLTFAFLTYSRNQNRFSKCFKLTSNKPCGTSPSSDAPVFSLAFCSTWRARFLICIQRWLTIVNVS